MRELLIFESIKQKMQNSNIQITKNGAKNIPQEHALPSFSRFAFSIIFHEIDNDFARCKHQNCLFSTHEHNHTNQLHLF